jgi:hypothetical protein
MVVPKEEPRLFFRELEVHNVTDKNAPYMYYTYSHHKFEEDTHLFELVGKDDDEMIKDLIKKFRIPVKSGDKLVFITQFFEHDPTAWDRWFEELEDVWDNVIEDRSLNIEKELDDMLGQPTKWVQVYTVP